MPPLPPRPALCAHAELQAVSNFSFLEGGSHPDELVAQAKALGLAALGLADRNTVAGVVRAHVAAKELGLRLIPGARLDLVCGTRLLCYPTDRPAWGRLCRLLSLGQGRAPKGECHLELDDVARHAQGQVLIVLAPAEWDWRQALDVGPSGPPPQDETASSADIIDLRTAGSRLDRERGPAPVRPPGAGPPAPRPSPVAASLDAGAPAAGGSRPACPGRGQGSPHPLPRPDGDLGARLHRLKARLAAATRLYLAASHTYRGDDRARLAALAALGRETGLPLIATGDVLYHAPHRRPLQDVLTAIRHHTTVAAAGLRLARNGERHLKSPAETARLWAGHEAALARTREVVEVCRFSLDELAYEYPDEPVPPGRTPQAHLEALVAEGARQRFPEGVPDKVQHLIRHELALIARLGYAPYFLTVHDIAAFARSRAILAQGRGSAANSVVCYCLGITAVNPTEIDVLFERFISPERREPPDIDVDFEHERREEVIQYIYARYGRDRAGLAATVISYRARSAVREVGKAMGLSEDTVAALAGMVWGTRSGGVLPDAHVREAGLDPADPLIARVIALADELSGFPRHLSQHVGGFVLTRGPLIEMVPVGNAAMADRTFIEWDKDDLAALGLLKIDVLALGMLTCIRKAFDLIALHEGPRLTLAGVPRDDPAVYDMLCRADSIGVFQVESRAQMNMLPRLKPRCFYDLVIEVAIVRPGPIQGDMVHPYLRRRSGLEPVSYPAPAPEHGPADELARILGKTLGVPLFQEQAMRIAMSAARFSDADVNELRKAMATFRRRGTIGRLEEKMVEAMVARGYERAFAERCFNQIKGFGEYGFPESHAASFAHLVYVSAWLKCHHPAAFAAALLNAQPMGFYAPAQIVRDAAEHGVEVRPPDVGRSDWDATLEAGQSGGGPALRLGLRQVDGLIEEEAHRIVAARAEAPGWSRPGRERGLPRPPPGAQLPDPQLFATSTRSSLAAKKRGGSGEASPERGMGRQPHSWQSHETAVQKPPSVAHPQPDPCVPPSVAHPQPDPCVPPSVAHPQPAGAFADVHELRQRSGVRLATLERLAAADAMRSLGLDRRQALWAVKGLEGSEPLPLFAWSAARETGTEPAVSLPAMPLSEHVVNDYQTLRLSLKAHPMSFLRPQLAARRIQACRELSGLGDGSRVAVAGVVLVRQRPGSAKGVVFMTIEDETGIANVVVWPKTLERYRRQVMTARLMLIRGRIQRHEDIIHVVSGTIEDRSDLLLRLMEDADVPLRIPIANADEVLRPEPGSARSPPRPRSAASATSAGRHPRDRRIIPPSRDFH